MILKSNALAQLIMKRRRELKISQSKLSKMLSMNRSGGQVLSNIERGRQQVPVKWVPLLAECLHVDVSEMVDAMILDYRESVLKAIYPAKKSLPEMPLILSEPENSPPPFNFAASAASIMGVI